ncbi:DUF3244 domain-containing protein [Bacteroides sp.]|mgnify:FL=1
MKTVLLFLLLIVGNINTYGQTSTATGQIIEFRNKRPKDRGGDIGGNTPIRRSVFFQAIYAYLDNNVMSLNFEESLSTVTISIISETTGDIIYSGNYDNPNSLTIDLSTESSGDYIIEIEFDDILLEGCFVLE